MSNYKLGGASAYWVFPSAAARLAEEIFDYEINKFAYQTDTGKLYILSSTAPATWTDISGTAGGAPASYEQGFAAAALSWTVNHNLGREPFVMILNNGGAELIAEIQHVSINQLIVYFSSAQAGRIRAF